MHRVAGGLTTIPRGGIIGPMKTSLSPPIKLAGFAGAMVAVLGLSFGVARAVAPDGLSGRSSAGDHDGHAGTPTQGADPHAGMDMSKPQGTGDHGAAASAAVPGLAVAQDGYRFVPEATTLASGPAQPFRFRLEGPDGRPVERYQQLHEREVHLIVVRRDLTGYQHVHPTRGPDGTWAGTLDLPAGGTWRAYADFAPTGGPAQLTLGVDLQVGGSFEPGTGPAAAAAPDPRFAAGFDRRGDDVEIVVSRDGSPLETEPYLGARGHLVALRTGDLAYLHVHPETGGAPAVRFKAELPTAGTYALFFDYQVDGVVRTATTTTEVPHGNGH